MNGRNDEREIEDDGWETLYQSAPAEYVCPKCAGTGYRRDIRGYQLKCDDCWNDLGPEE